MEKPRRKDIFICYSHKDKDILERINEHLKPYLRDANVTAWSDEQIKPGKNWDEEIKAALKRSKVALLLVSHSFFASNYIYEEELPHIITASRKEGLVIAWLHVKPTNYWEDTFLYGIESIQSNPGTSIMELETEAKQIRAFADAAKEISKLL